MGDRAHFGRILRIANWCAAGLALAILAQTAAGLSTTLDESVQSWQAARNLLALGDPYATTPSIGDLAAFPNPPLLAVASAPPTTAGLFLGQLGIMLALASAASFVLARRYPVASGALLALASAIKLYPALLGIYYLKRGPRGTGHGS